MACSCAVTVPPATISYAVGVAAQALSSSFIVSHENPSPEPPSHLATRETPHASLATPTQGEKETRNYRRNRVGVLSWCKRIWYISVLFFLADVMVLGIR